MSQWLIFLAIVPVSCFYLTKNMKTKKRFMWNGIAFGMVIAPVSFGLIQMTYIPLVGKLLGLVGIVGACWCCWQPDTWIDRVFMFAGQWST